MEVLAPVWAATTAKEMILYNRLEANLLCDKIESEVFQFAIFWCSNDVLVQPLFTIICEYFTLSVTKKTNYNKAAI